MKKERIIMGIDPGTIIMGYALIHCKGNTTSLLVMDVLKLGKLSTHALKLKKIFETTLRLIDEWKPDELAIEAPFYGKNVQSMLKLGRAQGVCMAAGLYRDIPIFEYSPRKIKQSITGRGSASKEQLAGMLSHLIDSPEHPEYYDSTDALAVAYCQYLQSDLGTQKEKFNSWTDYLRSNPGKERNP